MWPIDRSPRNEARPRIAFIGTVASAAALATAIICRCRLAGGERPGSGYEHVEHGLLAALRLAARLHRIDRPREGDGESARRLVGSSLPSVMRKVP